jgi:hypothetical protein
MLTTEVAVAAQREADERTELDENGTTRPELWSEVRIDPVEIALPKGVGYTLRAYRPVTELTPTDISEREVEDDFTGRTRTRRIDDEKAIVDEEEEEEEDADDLDVDDLTYSDDEEDDDEDGDEEDEDGEDDDDLDDEDEEEDGDEDKTVVSAEPEEVPIFLGHAGRLYLFRSVEGLTDFVHSGEPHDLTQVDTWSDLSGRLTAADVVPLPEDTYELDLVVENLRGGQDAWDGGLLIQAGEVARDIGYALRLDTVIGSLSGGSPLDDLDEALRASESGGFGGFMARRKLKKIGAEAAPLGWRTIIGKISAVVDWRD